MSSSNMVLLIGALVLFGKFLVSSNGIMRDNTIIASQNEYAIAAISIAQSVIDEAKTKNFDQNTIISSPSSLTVNGNLGADAGETVPKPDTLTSTGYKSMTAFNDIDDYNKYSRRVNTSRAEGYNVQVTVGYASATYPDSGKSTPTYCKKMTVTVSSIYISQPVTLSYAFEYIP